MAHHERIRDAGVKVQTAEEYKKERAKELQQNLATGKKMEAANKEDTKVCTALLQKADRLCASCGACSVQPLAGLCTSRTAMAAFEDWSGIIPMPKMAGCIYWRARPK